MCILTLSLIALVSIGGVITITKLKENLRRKNILYAKIKDVQPNTVTLEEIDIYGETQKCEYRSSLGVSDEVCEGQMIIY
jgi:hypothetical protein